VPECYAGDPTVRMEFNAGNVGGHRLSNGTKDWGWRGGLTIMQTKRFWSGSWEC